MGQPVITGDHVAELLNQWYLQIEEDKLDEGNRTRSEIKQLLDEVEADQPILFYYTLLEYRYQERINEKRGLTEQYESQTKDADNQLNYYFFLYKGQQAYNINAYDEALKNYLQAERFLDHLPDEMEKAEFYYKVASLYYHMCKTESSLEMAKKALRIFEKHSHEMRVASCYIIIALNLINLKKFCHAEDLLALAWATSVYKKDFLVQAIICHNLGLLYKEKKEPGTSIKWLLESMKYSEPEPSTYYLLAEAAFQLNQTGNGNSWIESGMRLSQSMSNVEYLHRFRILKVRYSRNHPEKFEKVLEEAIRFFEQEGSWLYVKENIPYLIDLYIRIGREEKIEEYKQLELLAKQKLDEKGTIIF